MGKKKESAAAAAAAQQQAPNEGTQPKQNSIAVVTLGDLDKLAQQRALVGMDPNHMEDLVGRLDDRFYKDADAAKKYNIPQDTVDKINEITARAMIALLANEVEIAQTPFAIRMRMSSLEALKEAGAAMNINIDTKALPAPDDKGEVVVPSTAVVVSEEAKKELAEERKAAERKVELDPTKIETEQQLKDSLLQILVKGNGSDNFYDRVMTAINFYAAYCKIVANKSDDKEAALAKIEEKSPYEHLSEIANLLGKCTFTVRGMAKFMYEQTERTKSPVVAFCTFRNASLNKKTGMPQIDDNLVAAIVKVLIRWYASTEIEESKKVIAGFEKDIEALKKDEKANAKAIKAGETKIETVNNHIKAVEEVIGYTNAPGREVIDAFPEDYVDSNREGYKMARMICSKVMDTYYPSVKPKEVDQDILLHNVQQYMGVISNMFMPPMDRFEGFSEANIAELKKSEAAEESVEQEDTKN